MAALKIALTQLVPCALLGVIGIHGKPPSAILGGDFADDNEFPYLVSLYFFGEHICGGTIIDLQHILTAAHCVDGVVYPISNMTIIAGTTYVNVGMGEEYRSRNVTIHPGYSKTKSDRWRDDIAVVTLSNAIKLNRRRRPAKLPTSDTPAGTRVTVCGWGDWFYPKGYTSTGLRKLSMVVVPNSRCALPGMADIHESHICAYSSRGAGLCWGDSGGPLLDDETVVGISSFAVLCGKGYPDVFTRVRSYVDWINEVTDMH